jgi:PKD repeat protein
VGEIIEFIDESVQATEYFWEFPSGYPSTSREANPKVQFFSEGTHDVLLRVTGCGGDIDQMARYGMIEINSSFELRLNQSDLTICRGEKIELQAAGAETYEWSPSNGLSSEQGARVVATPSVSTTYTVIGRNQNGCQASQEITLAVAGEAGSLKLTPFAPSICQGEKIELQASGGISYFWTPEQHIDRTFGDRVLVNPGTSTTYRVEATTSDGCVIRDSIRVQVRKVTPLKISPEKPEICAGEQVSLSLNQTGAFRWTPASSLSAATGSKVTAFPKQSTVYNVRGTDQYGCPGEASVTVQVGKIIPFVASVQDSVICQGGKTLLTATGGSDYAWSPAASLNQATGAMVAASPIQTTTYTVTSAGGSCGSERKLTVVVRPSNLLRIEPRSPNLCRGQSVELNVTGGNPRTYIWDNQEGLNTIAGAKVRVRPQQSISYKVRGLDEFLCEVEGTVTVQVADQNFLEVSAQQRNICSEEAVVLEARGANDYEWLATGQTTRSISVAPKEQTTYQVVGTLGPGCRDTASVEVSVGQLAGDFQISADRIDLAKEAGVVQFTDGTPGATSWKWEFAGRSTSEQKNPRHVFSETGTQTVRLLVSNGTCEVIVSKELEVINSSSLADLESEGNILVSSRTLDGIIQVNMDLPRAMLLQMRLLNDTGTELASGALRLKAGPYEQKLSLAGLPANTYTFELSDGVAVRRFPVAYDKGK